MQSGAVLRHASTTLGSHGNLELEQALLTMWHDLLRTGYLAWGYNIANPNPPFCHLTEQGRRTLEHLSRDPANPDGYLAHLSELGVLNPVAASYVEEAIRAYNADCYKAVAVMTGCASESLIIELRDTLTERMEELGKTVPNRIQDWRIKTVLDALNKELEGQKASMPRSLTEAFDSYWLAFIQQIRAARNDAGHPTSIEPVTPDTVHASLLIFPELAKLAGDLRKWIHESYT